jgi:copper(I)-binding protein
MKHLLVVLMALVVVGITGIPGECASPSVASAVVTEPDFSFGTVPEGTKVTHTFVIRNKGDAKLFISKVETG